MKAQPATERFGSRRGGAMVEFALVFPLLLVLCLAAGDFGRLFFHGVTVVNAASSGAHYGSLNNGFAAQSGEMESRYYLLNQLILCQ